MRFRKRRPLCTCYQIYLDEFERSVRYAAKEIAGWPEPIDVMRESMGLPERWQLRAARGWHALLGALSPSMPYTHLAFGVGDLYSSILDAAIGPPRCARHA